MTSRVVMLAVVLAISGCGSRPALREGSRADAVIVEKRARRLTLLSGGDVLAVYSVALGREPVGAKDREGDNKTPEGKYRIDSRNERSAYYRSLHVSYPNADDRARAAALGVPPGGDIMIHGIRNGLGWIGSLHRVVDWTRGCIAVTDEEIEQIWALVPDNTPIEIRP